MNWKQILTTAGIAIGAAVGGYYAVPESEMDKALVGIETVTDTLTPAHWEWRDSAEVHLDSVWIESRYIPISRRINTSKVFNIGDTIIYIAVEKKNDSTVVFGLRHIVGRDGVSYISKYDEVFK